jgi:hypothetical protein
LIFSPSAGETGVSASATVLMEMETTMKAITVLLILLSRCCMTCGTAFDGPTLPE